MHERASCGNEIANFFMTLHGLCYHVHEMLPRAHEIGIFFSACPFGGSVHLSLSLIALNAAINLRAKLASEKLHCADFVHNPTKITGHDVKSRAIY